MTRITTIEQWARPTWRRHKEGKEHGIGDVADSVGFGAISERIETTRPIPQCWQR